MAEVAVSHCLGSVGSHHCELLAGFSASGVHWHLHHGRWSPESHMLIFRAASSWGMVTLFGQLDLFVACIFKLFFKHGQKSFFVIFCP